MVLLKYLSFFSATFINKYPNHYFRCYIFNRDCTPKLACLVLFYFTCFNTKAAKSIDFQKQTSERY